MPLNESPSEKEGKFQISAIALPALALNESPSEKEGKFLDLGFDCGLFFDPQ